jgi:hypothetical protein
MNGKKNRFFDLVVSIYGMNYRISSLINLKSLSYPAGHNLNTTRLLHGRDMPGSVPLRHRYLSRRTSKNQVLVMVHYSTSDEIKACRALALERNHQMFEEAQALSRSAFALLEGSDMDVEQFDRYRALRRKADLKFKEAIEHLRLLNEDFPPVSISTQNAHRSLQQPESIS